MIILYSGLPRSGKSHNAVEFGFIPYLKAGRTIVTNIPLRMEDGSIWDGLSGKPLILHDYPKGNIIFFDKMDPIKNVDVISGRGVKTASQQQFDEEFFMDRNRFPLGAVYIIDECWRYWPAGLRADKISVSNKEFFTEHGHRAGHDNLTEEIILVTQNHKQLATFVCDLIDKTYRTTKLDMLGFKNRYHLDIFQQIPSSEKSKGYKSHKSSYSPKVYQYYVSHTNTEDDSPGVEAQEGDRSNFMRGALIKLAILAVLAFFAFSFVFDRFFTSPEVETVEVVVDENGNEVTTVKTTVSSDFVIPGQGLVYITGHFKSPQMVHFFKTNSGYTYTSTQLLTMGYSLSVKSLCVVLVTDFNGNEMTARCGYSAPTKEG